jgi:hypothetical protein
MVEQLHDHAREARARVACGDGGGARMARRRRHGVLGRAVGLLSMHRSLYQLVQPLSSPPGTTLAR